MSNAETYGDYPVVEGLMSYYSDTVLPYIAKRIGTVSEWFCAARDEVLEVGGSFKELFHINMPHEKAHAAEAEHRSHDDYEEKNTEHYLMLRALRLLRDFLANPIGRIRPSHETWTRDGDLVEALANGEKPSAIGIRQRIMDRFAPKHGKGSRKLLHGD